MGDLEWPLELQRNLQQPIEAVGIARLAAIVANLRHALHHRTRHAGRVVDDHLVARLRGAPQGRADEAVDLLEILGAVGRTREHNREGQVLIGGIEQYAEQVQNLFGRSGAAGKNHDAVPQAHERFEALFNVRHDDQLAHDGVGRLRGNDAGFGDPQVPAIGNALFRMTDGRSLHRPLHRTRTAAGTDIQAAQAEFVAYFFRIVVLEASNGVPAPADHEIGPHLQLQYARVAQDVENRIGNAGRGIEVITAALHDFVGDEHHIAQHGEQVVFETPDHDAVDKCRRRRVLDLELDAPGLAHDAKVEVAILFKDRARIVDFAAGVEHGERALPKQGIQAALPGIQQFGDFLLRQVLQAALWGHPRIDHVGRKNRGFHAAPIGEEYSDRLSRVDIDRNIILRAHPHLDHVGVRQSDAAIGPVVRLIIRPRMVGRVGETVNHDRAARSPALLMRAYLVDLVWIRYLNGQKVLAAGVAPREEIAAFGSFKVALAFLLSNGAQSQRYFVDAQEMLAAVQIQLVLGFMDHDSVGQNRLRAQGVAHPARTRRQHQTHEKSCRRIPAESIDHCQKYTWSRPLNNRL